MVSKATQLVILNAITFIYIDGIMGLEPVWMLDRFIIRHVSHCSNLTTLFKYEMVKPSVSTSNIICT